MKKSKAIKSIGFKKKSNSVEKYKQRLNIDVEYPTHFAIIPSCSHGPCLLFNNKAGERWFSCAVYRQSKECKYRVLLDDNGNMSANQRPSTIYTRPLEEYGLAKKRFDELKDRSIDPSWCNTCANFVDALHNHCPLIGPFADLPSPTSLFIALQNDRGEAQYWFSDETMQILRETLERERFDSVLCVGAPFAFELLQSSFKRRFLLDIDDRLSLFYGCHEFARYSMLVDYFFHANARSRLRDFLADARRLVIVCDPPFGVYVKALMRSLDALKSLAIEASNNVAICKFVIFLPLFVGKHILRNHADFTMVDFKVTYRNHRDFARADCSIVRIFTNMENRLFQLPAALGYRFCELCERFVTETNAHCSQCDRCTSLDGSKYAHCAICGKCFKTTYAHCRKCKTCHLRNRCLVTK